MSIIKPVIKMGEYRTAHFLSFVEATTSIVMVIWTSEVAAVTTGRISQTLRPALGS